MKIVNKLFILFFPSIVKKKQLKWKFHFINCVLQTNSYSYQVLLIYKFIKQKTVKWNFLNFFVVVSKLLKFD